MTARAGRPAQPVPPELVADLTAAVVFVEQAELALLDARRDLANLVRRAIEAGASHRAIAGVLGVSSSRVGPLADLN